MGLREELLAEKGRLIRRLRQIDLLLDEYTTERRAIQASPRGLRGRIIEVLKAHPEGLVPRMVTRALKDSGYEDRAKTPLSNRVGNEMGLMFKEGILERERGVYTYKQQE